ncbi:MAG: peptidylprolyl isomerase [Firmicutes bacterium]|nr:peptidylprolyl isomerase [Bacillota bacterium]
MFKRMLLGILLVGIFVFAGCARHVEMPGKTEEPTEVFTTSFEEGEIVNVKITMQDGGVMELELYPDKAPETVQNFVDLAEAGFYNGLTFHRIVEGFMIQGGDPLGNGTGGASEKIKGEFLANGVKNTKVHKRGVISMARAMNPNSAGSQFFIMHQDAPHLDGQYAAFGEVVEGMDIVDAIASCRTGFMDRPVEEQKIAKIIVEDEEFKAPEKC